MLEKPEPNPVYRVMIGVWVILGLVVLMGGRWVWPWLVVVAINLYINYQYYAEARGITYRLQDGALHLCRQGEPDLTIRLAKVISLESYPGWAATRHKLRQAGVRGPVAAVPAYARGQRWLLLYEGPGGPAAASFFPSAELRASLGGGRG